MYVYDVSVRTLYSADVAAAYDRLLASTVEGDSNFPDFVFATAFSRLHTLITPEPASATVFWVPIWLAGVCLVHNATNGGYTEGWSWAKHIKDLPFWCPALHPLAAWVTEQSWWQRHQGAEQSEAGIEIVGEDFRGQAAAAMIHHIDRGSLQDQIADGQHEAIVVQYDAVTFALDAEHGCGVAVGGYLRVQSDNAVQHIVEIEVHVFRKRGS